MDGFTHLSVLISIVLGLGITNLLTGFARIVQMRRRVKVYWPTIVWGLVLLLIHVQTWWTMFGLRRIETWTFVAFGLVLLQPVLLFFLSALALPDFDRDEAFDLKANYFAQVHWFFGIIAVLLVASFLRPLALEGMPPAPADIAFHIGFLAGALPAATFTNERFHQLVALVAATAVFAYVALLFTVLR